MERRDNNNSLRRYPLLWENTLSKVIRNSCCKTLSDNIGLDEEDLDTLRRICAYAEMGFNPPPENYNGYSGDCVTEHLTINTAMFNHLASVHSITDIDGAAEVIQNMNS